VVRDARLRAAACCAASRFAGGFVPARGLFPPGLPGHDSSLTGQREDPARAARLLAEAGHPGGRGLAPLRITWRDWDQGVGNRLAQSLRRAGFRVEIRFLPDAAYRDAVRAGGAELFRDGWMADYPDPDNFLQLFYSGSPENRGAYRNAEYERLFVAFRAAPDAAGRLALARRLERVLVDDAAAIFLHHERETQLVASRVENWEGNCTNPLNLCYYEFVRVRPPARAAR
jgi:peptide/nickel transport system substrate-binding protein